MRRGKKKPPTEFASVDNLIHPTSFPDSVALHTSPEIRGRLRSRYTRPSDVPSFTDPPIKQHRSISQPPAAAPSI